MVHPILPLALEVRSPAKKEDLSHLSFHFSAFADVVEVMEVASPLERQQALDSSVQCHQLVDCPQLLSSLWQELYQEDS